MLLIEVSVRIPKFHEIHHVIGEGHEAKSAGNHFLEVEARSNVRPWLDELALVDDLDNCDRFDDHDLAHVGARDHLIEFGAAEGGEHLVDHASIHEHYRILKRYIIEIS